MHFSPWWRRNWPLACPRSTTSCGTARVLQARQRQVRLQRVPICLLIRQILVYPQAYAAVVPQAQAIRQNPRTFVVDIGGFTTDVLLLRGIQPDMQVCRSLELGVIQGRSTILPDDVRETIRSTVKKSYAAGILDKLRELQVDLRATPAVFMGGGAALFRPFFEESPQVAKAEFII